MNAFTEIRSHNEQVYLFALIEAPSIYTMATLVFSTDSKGQDEEESWDSDFYLVKDLYPSLKNNDYLKDADLLNLLKLNLVDKEELLEMFELAIQLGFFKSYDI